MHSSSSLTARACEILLFVLFPFVSAVADPVVNVNPEEFLAGIDTETGLVRATCLVASEGIPTPPTLQLAPVGQTVYKTGKTIEEYLSHVDMHEDSSYSWKAFTFSSRANFDSTDRHSRYSDYLIAERKTVLSVQKRTLTLRLNQLGLEYSRNGWVNFFARCGDGFFSDRKWGYWTQMHWTSEQLTESQAKAIDAETEGKYLETIKTALSGATSSQRTLKSEGITAEVWTVGAPAPKLVRDIDGAITQFNDFQPTSPVGIAWTVNTYDSVAIKGLPAIDNRSTTIIASLKRMGNTANGVATAMRQRVADLAYMLDHPREFGEPDPRPISSDIEATKAELATMTDEILACYRSGNAQSAQCQATRTNHKKPPDAPERGIVFANQLTGYLRTGAGLLDYKPEDRWRLISVKGTWVHDLNHTKQVFDAKDKYTYLAITDQSGKTAKLYGVSGILRLPPNALINFSGADIGEREWDQPTVGPNGLHIMIYDPLDPKDFAAAKCPESTVDYHTGINPGVKLDCPASL